jgi:hypothetical protein
MGVNFGNRKASAAGLDPQLVDLAIQMMLAGQVDIPAKVYREYQKRKEVSLNCDDIFLDLLPNYTVSQGSSYLATRTGSEYHYRPPNQPRYHWEYRLLEDHRQRIKLPMKPAELGYDEGWEYMEISQPVIKTKQHLISTERSRNCQVRNSINRSHGIWIPVKE